MEATNHPGADIQFYMDGDLIREVQLKAVSSPTLIYEHLKRYPDIEILVTEEMASVFDGIDSSGLSNTVLTYDVTERLYDLRGDGFLNEVTDGMVSSAFVTSGVLVYQTFKKKSGEAINFKPYLANAGVAMGTASLVDGVISIFGN